jgi:hypothetical protein
MFYKVSNGGTKAVYLRFRGNCDREDAGAGAGAFMLADFWNNYSTMTFYAKSSNISKLSYSIDLGTISDITASYYWSTSRVSGTLSVGQSLDLKAQNIQYNMALIGKGTGSDNWFVIKLE